MRIALLADIHGNLAALEAVERDLLQRGVDAVVNLGDSLSGPLLPRETAEFLMARDWVQLAGNHERQLLGPEPMGASDAYTRVQLTSREFEWMAALESSRGLDEDVLLCHGTPASDCVHLLATVEPTGLRLATREEVELLLGEEEAALVACGHTHLPLCLRTSRGQLIVNPGSVGLQAYVDSNPYPYSVETGSPLARYAIAERRADGWTAELIAIPYETEAMARLAQTRGFALWERALLNGRLA